MGRVPQGTGTPRTLLACAVLLYGCGNSGLINPAEAGADGGADGGVEGAADCEDITGSIAGTAVATFDNDDEQFIFDTAHNPASVNLADPTSGVTTPPTLAFDAAEGSPAAGALKVVVPFSGPNQYVVVYRFFGANAPRDWTGKVVHVRIKISEGTFRGGAQLYVSTTAAYAFARAFTALAPHSCWQDVRLDLRNPMTQDPGYDPSQVVAVGVVLSTGAAPDPGPAAFAIDTLWLE